MVKICGISTCNKPLFESDLCEYHFNCIYPGSVLRRYSEEKRPPRQRVRSTTPPSTLLSAPKVKVIIKEIPKAGSFEEEEFDAYLKRRGQTVGEVVRNCRVCKKVLIERFRVCIECTPETSLYHKDGNWIY